MKMTGFTNQSCLWIPKRRLIYFAFWLWGFLLKEGLCCPKVCECKWKGGKQWVTCKSAKFIDIPQGLDSSTQVLNLEHNNLKILFRDAFVDRGLVNLQKVFLPHCKLRKLEKGSLRKLANLVELDISFNFLRYVPGDALVDVPGLRDFRMRNNNLTFIPSDAFRSSPDVVHLDLGFNKIKVIDDRAFVSLSRLEELDLSGNRLVSLPVRVFWPLVSIHGLYIHANPWHCNCLLRPMRRWMLERNIAAPVPAICVLPRRLENRQWASLDLDEFVCVPHVTAVAPRVLASHGDNVSLACRVETDADAKVTWLMGNKAVAKGERSAEPRYKVLELLLPYRGNASRVSNLTISSADLHDQGTYRCVVENKAGRVETNLTLKVSEVISENSLVELDEVFVAGALLGGFAFVIFAIFIACVAFYRRKNRHAQNIMRMNIEMCDSSVTGSERSDILKATNHKGYAEYQILPTSDTERTIVANEKPNGKVSKVSILEPKPSVVVDNQRDFYLSDSDQSSIENKKDIDHLGLKSDERRSNYEKPNKVSLLPEDPLLQNLAEQCKNEALKRQQCAKDVTSLFTTNVASNLRFPDLLTSQRSEIQFSTLPRESSRFRPDLQVSTNVAESSFHSVLEQTISRSPSTLLLKETPSHYRKTPSLPSTPLQSEVAKHPWDNRLQMERDSARLTDRFSSYEPFNYQYHANQLEHFLQEYKSLQEELYRMKETAVEAPEEKVKITSRSSSVTQDVSPQWTPSQDPVPSPAKESFHDNKGFSLAENHLKSLLKPKKDSLLRRNSLNFEEEDFSLSS